MPTGEPTAANGTPPADPQTAQLHAAAGAVRSEGATPKPLKRVTPAPPPSSATAPNARRLTAWVGVACLLAIIGIAAGAVGVTKALNASHANNSLRGQLTALQHRVSTVASQMTTIPGRATMAAVQSDVSGIKSRLAGQSKAITGLQNKAATYTNCIPEIQTELSGLTINWNIDTTNVSNSSFGIDNSSQISHDCTKLLYGS